jgi:hypothetical protein
MARREIHYNSRQFSRQMTYFDGRRIQAIIPSSAVAGEMYTGEAHV